MNAQWEQLNGPKHDFIFSINKKDSLIYFGGLAGLYVLNNQNNNISLISNGLPNPSMWFYINSIEILDTSILIGTSNDGFLKLVNSTWTPADTGIAGSNISVCGIYEINDTIISITSSGVYNTINEGNSWNHIYNFPYTSDGLGTAKQNSNLFYAYSTDTLFYISINKGQNWTAISKIPYCYYTRCIAANDTCVIISSDSTNLLISFDDGYNWQDISPGISNTYITSLAVNDSIIYVGTFNKGIFYSSDYGQTWNELNDNLAQWSVNSLFTEGNSVYAGMHTGIYFLQNLTSEWEFFGTGNYGYENVTPSKIITHKNFIYINGAGLQISLDKGNNWTFINNGFSNLDNNNYAMDIATVGDTLIALVKEDGVFYSNDFGNHWHNISGNLPFGIVDFYDIAVLDSDIFITSEQNGIYKSSDWGLTWNTVNNGLYYDSISNGYHIYNLEESDSIIIASGYYPFVYKTIDKGQTWTITTNNYGWYLKMKNNNIIAITPFGPNISTDYGNTWTLISSGLPYWTETDSEEVDGTSCGIYGNNFFVGTHQGTYYLYDSTWVPVNYGFTLSSNHNYYVSDIVFNDSIMYIGYDGFWQRHISDISINKHTGSIFADINNNNIKDSTDYGMPFVIVETKNDNSYYTSDTLGNYKAYTEYFQDTLVSVQPSPYATVSPLYYFITVSDTGNNFAVHFIPDIKDLRVTVTDFFNANPGFDDIIRITYKNIGTDTMDGVVKLVFVDSLVFSNSTPNYTSLNYDTLSWDFNNLLPFESRNINITFYVPVNFLVNPDTIGFVVDSIPFSSYIYPIISDTVPADNSDSFYQYVTSSYDPNSTEVNPRGCITPTDIASGEILVYTIRFQNTGTDTAHFVTIIDSLDHNLDIPTFDLLSASHPYTYSIKGKGIVEFNFPNIFLPDSNANELLSHGFVKFSIKPKNFVQPGNTIKNKANIYFDFNPPVVTNTTSNPIQSLCGITGPNYNGQSVLIFPNPTNNTLTIAYSSDEKPIIEIFDVNCRCLFKKQTTNEHFINIDVSKYSQGVYFVKAIFEETVESGKFIVQ